MNSIFVILILGSFHLEHIFTQAQDESEGQGQPAFDLEKMPAYLIVVPVAIKTGRSTFGQGATDVPLVLQMAGYINMAWFDALAPYHPTAKGIFIDIPKRPESERTLKNKNIAFLHCAFQTMIQLLPDEIPTLRKMLTDHGLDPDDTEENMETPVGIGNLAGINFMRAKERDGFNRLGDETGTVFNRVPYCDYTGYAPVNNPFKIVDPTRWQPEMRARHTGSSYVQTFLLPQFGNVTPMAVSDVGFGKYQVAAHGRSLTPQNDWYRYKADLDEVLEISANLTDKQKMLAEFFDDKFDSLASSVIFIIQTRNLTLDEFVHLDLLTNIAGFDTMIFVWQQKRKYDAVRPTTAAKYIYGRSKIRGYGGPGKGTVNDIPATEWLGYMSNANHPEYPSASAGACAAHAEAIRQLYGTDEYGWTVTFPKGSSKREPGITPKEDLTITFKTWTEFETLCGLSRLYGGVHFRDSIEVVKEPAHEIGRLSHEFLQKHLNAL